MDDVVGLDEHQVASRLGSPTARRDGHPGTSWIYRDSGCELDIALYPDVRTHTNKVLSYEVTSNASRDRSRCVATYAARIAAK